jgi:Tfp pilus assembly protein PilO
LERAGVRNMKNGVYNILKARFLINEDANATKNWRFIVFLIFLAIIMIANTQRFEQKVFRIAELNNEVKELRSEFVDRRSELMKLKMESTISTQMESKQIFPASVPPIKIEVKKIVEKSFFEKLWK